jgi:hypothetical protein
MLAFLAVAPDIVAHHTIPVVGQDGLTSPGTWGRRIERALTHKELAARGHGYPHPGGV